ncbi:MAG: TlpA family protein disulfide reductase [Gammaproteobacteria bacterium]|nr:TlpA family protein disulfide reductase [Gammaproteobacteria bacterium]
MKHGRTRITMLTIVYLLAVLPGVGMSGEQPFAASDYRGTVVVLDFWASWCVPCRRSFPWLNSMHEKYGDAGLVIVGVNLDNDHKAAMEFLEEYPARFQIHYDDNKELATKFDVVAMPSSYVLNRAGEVIAKHYGFKVRRQGEYEAVIAAALGNSGANP